MLGIDCFCEEEQGEALVFKFVGNSLESEATVTFLQTVRFASHLFYFFFQRSHFQSLMGLQSTRPKNKMGLTLNKTKQCAWTCVPSLAWTSLVSLANAPRC